MDTCDSTNSRYLSVYLVLLTIFQQAHEDLIRILSSTMVVRCSALSTARSSCSLVTTVAAPPSLSAISEMISSTTCSEVLRLFRSAAGIRWYKVFTRARSSSLLIYPFLSTSRALQKIRYRIIDIFHLSQLPMFYRNNCETFCSVVPVLVIVIIIKNSRNPIFPSSLMS